MMSHDVQKFVWQFDKTMRSFPSRLRHISQSFANVNRKLA